MYQTLFSKVIVRNRARQAKTNSKGDITQQESTNNFGIYIERRTSKKCSDLINMKDINFTAQTY